MIKDVIKSTPLLALTIFIIVFLILYALTKYRKKQLANDAFQTFATVELLKENQRDGKSDTMDLVYFYFIKNDSVIHKIKQLPAHSIQQRNIVLNNTYPIKVATTDYGAFEIDFAKTIDTTLHKNAYKTQIYNSALHRNIIE